ncbi:MAG: NAD(P)H:quinone oxidoreductase [Candidatus Bathyarchaeia archaeon]
MAEADGIIFGTPTRYGNMSAQMKQFIDKTGGLWAEGKLINKVAGVFTSTSTLHGGQETALITSMIPLLHHGMILVGIPYSEQRLFSLETGGGSPYGASSVSGPNADRPPTENDLEIAKALGRRVAEIAKKISQR